MRINSQGWRLIFSIRIKIVTFLIMDKEERKKNYKSLSSEERQEFILKKMKTKGIEV